MKKALSLIIVSTIIITTLMGCGKEESKWLDVLCALKKE